jgi:hypothetical protein
MQKVYDFLYTWMFISIHTIHFVQSIEKLGQLLQSNAVHRSIDRSGAVGQKPTTVLHTSTRSVA